MDAGLFSGQDSEILAIVARKKVYQTVKRFPGTHFRYIEKMSSLPASTVSYHLHYLARHGLLTEQKDGVTTRYFPKEFTGGNKRLMGLLRQQSIRRILLCLVTQPGCNHPQIVDFVKLSPATVSWHLKKLEQSAIIGVHKAGRSSSYQILADKKEIMNLLITYQESFFDTLVDRAIEMWDA